MSTKNLLVVDDSATTRMLISLTLKKEGVYRIVEVANGREAVDKLSVEPVDCVLTDINMPQMNGLDLISYIRSQHREPISGTSSPSCRPAGGEYCSRPVRAAAPI
jgi:CheY-like chemotaxis protein